MKIPVLSFLFVVGLSICLNASGNTPESIVERKKELLSETRREIKIEHDVNKRIGLYDQMARLNDYLGNYDEAIACYYMAIQLSDELNGNSGVYGFSKPWLLVDIGNVLYKKGDFDRAKDLYFYANSVFCRHPQSIGYRGQITCINNIGLCFSDEPARALFYHLLALRISIASKDRFDIALSNVYLGSTYTALSRFAEAEESLLSAVKFNSSVSDTAQLIYAKNELAQMYLKSGAYKQSLEQVKDVIETLRGKTNSPGFTKAVLTEIKCLVKLGQTNDALEMILNYIGHDVQIDVVYSNAMEINHDSLIESEGNEMVLDLNTRKEMYEIAYECYKKQNDFSNALLMHEKLFILADSVNIENNAGYLKNIEYRIRSQSIRTDLKIMEERQKFLQEQRNSERRLSVFLLLAAVIFIVFIYGNKNRMKYWKQIVVGFVEGFSAYQKMLVISFFGIYNLCFFYFFTPLTSQLKAVSLSTAAVNFLPGLYSFAGIFIFYLLKSGRVFNRRKSENKWNNSGILSIILLTIIIQVLHYWKISGAAITINLVLTVSLLVFASYVLPFNIMVLILENYIIKEIVSKAASMTKGLKSIINNTSEGELEFRSPKSNDSFSISRSALIAVKAQGNYCKFFYTENGKSKSIMLLITVKNVEQVLSEYSEFIRCHNSYIMNLKFIEKISGNSRGFQLKSEQLDELILVSRSRQAELNDRIRSLSQAGN